MKEHFLVVGGSGGIGQATCLALSKVGFCPIVGYVTRHAAAREVAAATNGMVLNIDLASALSIDAALKTLGGGISLAGVVLAASPPPIVGPFHQIEPGDLERQLRVNVMGVSRLLAGLLDLQFRPRRRGTIVAILSAAMGGEGAAAMRHMGAYLVAKFGLSGVLAAIAADYPWLAVERLYPGFTDTGMLEAFDPRFLELVRERQGITTPGEVAAMVVDRVVPR